MTRTAVDALVAAVHAGRPVLMPTDTVYGLCATSHSADAADLLARLKGRERGIPLALAAASVDALVELVPELRGRAEATARALLPGPLTLVVANPAGRFAWLSGERAGTLGVRVPALAGEARQALDRVQAVVATSANLHGGPDPRRLADVPAGIRAACAAELDGGDLPGIPSTVLDLSGPEPRVLREGAVPAAEALARAAAVAT